MGLKNYDVFQAKDIDFELKKALKKKGYKLTKVEVPKMGWGLTLT